MNDFPEVDEEFLLNEKIKDLIRHIKGLDAEIKNYEKDKQLCEEQLRVYLNHEKSIDGQRSYPFENETITITTGYNRRLNKDKYLECKATLNPIFNPIVETIDYKISPQVYNACLEYGTPDDQLAMSNFIMTTDKKLHISIKPKKEKK